MPESRLLALKKLPLVKAADCDECGFRLPVGYLVYICDEFLACSEGCAALILADGEEE